MTDLVRQEIAATATLVVVKVGTKVLTCDDGTLDQQQVASLSSDICALMDEGRQVVLVSSGSVGAGIGRLGLDSRPTGLAKLQAVAAVGQSHLIEVYESALRQHGRHAAQLLLTAEDMNDRQRYLNVRNTILKLIEFGAVPIINENDTVSVAELLTTFGDNDQLAAMVTNLIRAPLLILLSDVDGLYDRDPDQPDAKIVPLVHQVDSSILKLVQDTTGDLSKGGMASKLKAADIATSGGENVIIANGRTPGILQQIVAAKEVGTLFLAQGKSVSPLKRWIGFTARPKGKIILDAGAYQAIADNGSSLLAIGIADTAGEFSKGDVVFLCKPDGQEFARGLTNYDQQDVQKIKGKRTDEIIKIIGHRPYDEVIHRDNLALTE